MAIEVTKKRKEIDSSKGLDLFFQFSVVLFVLAGAFYSFMVYMTNRAEGVNEEIRQFTEQQRAEFPEKQELELLAQKYHNLIGDFKDVSKRRSISSPFFLPFQGMIHPQARVANISIDLQDSAVIFMGSGADLIAVGQQFTNLKNREYVENVSLTNIALTEEEGASFVRFAFSATIDSSLFEVKLEEND